MRAAITQREQMDSYGTAVDFLEAAYTLFFERYGVDLCPVPNFTADPDKYLKDVEMLILTGGGDLPAYCYADGREGGGQEHRDETERKMIETCLLKGIPILAICRGMQYINGILGGKVRKLINLKEQRPIRNDHPVMLCAQRKPIMVNNYHNDGIYREDLAAGLKIIALDETNGVVEAFESEERRILALQWHPERPYEMPEHQEETDTLIKMFLNSI